MIVLPFRLGRAAACPYDALSVCCANRSGNGDLTVPVVSAVADDLLPTTIGFLLARAASNGGQESRGSGDAERVVFRRA